MKFAHSFMDDITVLDESITSKDIKNIFTEFKKFNSSAQRIPLGYLPEILKLFSKKKNLEIVELGEKESFLQSLRGK